MQQSAISIHPSTEGYELGMEARCWQAEVAGTALFQFQAFPVTEKSKYLKTLLGAIRAAGSCALVGFLGSRFGQGSPIPLHNPLYRSPCLRHGEYRELIEALPHSLWNALDWSVFCKTTTESCTFPAADKRALVGLWT